MASVQTKSRLPSRGKSPRPWGPQMLGLLVLALSFLMIYDTSSGARMLEDVAASFAGTQVSVQTASSALSRDPSLALSSALRAMAPEIRSGAWSKAGADLQAAEEAWARVQGTYQEKGVTPTDLNALTGDLAELQMDIAQRNKAGALTEIGNAQRTFDSMAATVMTGRTPSLDAMAQLVEDLQGALKAGDLTRARADATDLSNMLHAIEQGF